MGIDAVAKIEEYRGLVIAQPGSARMAREAATMLLVSRFYFIICGLPEDTTAPFWCCWDPHSPSLKPWSIFTLTARGGCLIMDCWRTSRDNPGFAHHAGATAKKSESLPRHEDHEINIFLETGSKKRWRASGFPATVASFVDKQGFHSRFGPGRSRKTRLGFL
ncbi:phospholipase patatin family protein [Penicillium chermesinum]|nr:phospholipase patatin family protein [Penicillium chermesinum]